MPTTTHLLDLLRDHKQLFGDRVANLSRALKTLAKRRITDADSLIRLHESLLFLRAYPPNADVLTQVERMLRSFDNRVVELRKLDVDLSQLDDPEVSGIAGTAVTSNFSYTLVRWLAKKFPSQLSIDWDWFDNEETFGAITARFLPLLAEDAMVEAHVPYREWLGEITRHRKQVGWLIDRFESLEMSEQQRAQLYDALKLHVRWQFGFASSRTGMTLPRGKFFFHRQPLLERRDISLTTELKTADIPIDKLSSRSGETYLGLARATSAVRYRELHGFTFGDARMAMRATLGRGTEAFLFDVAPEHRLPLRAYHAVLIFKNGVPVAYFEGLSLFERMESGFNLYYTFRDGETAWLFARILRLMHQLVNVSVISIDPYQIGHENEEGIESGAFWFYRKLGFRPVRHELLKLTLKEEARIAANRDYRTPAAILRKLAAGHMLLDMSQSGTSDKNAWDNFETRRVGFAVQKRVARDFAGDPAKLFVAAVSRLRRTLGQDIEKYSDALQAFAPLLAMIPDLEEWSQNEKVLLSKIIKAKARRSESVYLKLMQRHKRLRAAVISLGSK